MVVRLHYDPFTRALRLIDSEFRTLLEGDAFTIWRFHSCLKKVTKNVFQSAQHLLLTHKPATTVAL
jgi:hypothetical protein